MDYRQARSARRLILVTILAFGAYTTVQRVIESSPLGASESSLSGAFVPELRAKGVAGTVRQVAEAPEAPVRQLPGNPIYIPAMASRAVEETALAFRVADKRTIRCTVIAPADTTGELPLVLGVTDTGISMEGIDRHVRRLAMGGYLVVVLHIGDQRGERTDALRSLVTIMREAVAQLGTAMRSRAVRPSRSICLVGSGPYAEPLLALAGVPIDSRNGWSGAFRIPDIKAVILFDPFLRSDGPRKLDLAAGSAVPVLLVHESARREFTDGSSRLYRIGGGPQHMMDILHYRRVIPPSEDADAAFRKDVSSMSEAFVDAFLKSSPHAIRYLSSYLEGLSPVRHPTAARGSR